MTIPENDDKTTATVRDVIIEFAKKRGTGHFAADMFNSRKFRMLGYDNTVRLVEMQSSYFQTCIAKHVTDDIIRRNPDGIYRLMFDYSDSQAMCRVAEATILALIVLVCVLEWKLKVAVKVGNDREKSWFIRELEKWSTNATTFDVSRITGTHRMAVAIGDDESILDCIIFIQ